MKSDKMQDAEEILAELCNRFESKFCDRNDKESLFEADSLSKVVEKYTEQIIKEILEEKKGCTGDDVELIAGRRFPDITLFENVGIEVKTSKKGWVIPGNSVNESSRISEVDRIFIFFVNCSNGNVKCKYRSYESCVSGFGVTHSPRYKINMELESGDCVFEKMGMTYSDFSNHEDPRKLAAEYICRTSRAGEVPWFSMNPQSVSSPTMTSWASVDSGKKEELSTAMYARFPEVVGNSKEKYHRVAGWLIRNHGIINPSLRDLFSAGGVGELKSGGKLIYKVPAVLMKLNKRMPEIVKFLSSNQEVGDPIDWGFQVDRDASLLVAWKNSICQYCDDEHLELLKSLITKHCP